MTHTVSFNVDFPDLFADNWLNRHGKQWKMDTRFKDIRLQQLRDIPATKSRFDNSVVKAYRKLMNIVAQALDERDLRSMKSLHFKSLNGNRSHQYSLRLNDQWRLIVQIDKSEPKNTIVVIDIEDYHR